MKHARHSPPLQTYLNRHSNLIHHVIHALALIHHPLSLAFTSLWFEWWLVIEYFLPLFDFNFFRYEEAFITFMLVPLLLLRLATGDFWSAFRLFATIVSDSDCVIDEDRPGVDGMTVDCVDIVDDGYRRWCKSGVTSSVVRLFIWFMVVTGLVPPLLFKSGEDGICEFWLGLGLDVGSLALKE